MKDEEQDDTEEFVEDGDESTFGDGPGAVKRLRERLKIAVEEKQEYLDGWQRSRAEFVNYKKQEASFGAEREARAKSDAVEKLLPALDAMELAMRHDKATDPTLKMLHSQFMSSLKAIGVEQFGAVGDEVDPRYYEPLSSKEVEDESQDHTVVSVERSGYRIGKTVVRPAQVIVGVYK